MVPKHSTYLFFNNYQYLRHFYINFSCLQSLKTCLSAKTLAQLNIIVTALLAMADRVTMLGISRWAGEGGSYRTVQRFYNTPIAWTKVHWCLIRHCFLSSDNNSSDYNNALIIAGDSQ